MHPQGYYRYWRGARDDGGEAEAAEAADGDASDEGADGEASAEGGGDAGDASEGEAEQG